MPDPTDIGDYASRRGAEAIAAAVRAYWTSQGYFAVQTWVEGNRFQGSEHTHPCVIWCVRSNLVNGLPPP